MDRLTDTVELEGWIPVRHYWSQGQPMVEWCYLGCHGFDGSSFNRTIEECLRSPFNLLFRHQTPIELLRDWAALRPGLKPAGFVFHLSRCGSTLVSRMLASVPANIVISEARPIDSILRTHFQCVDVTDDQRIAWLRWLISALSQPRREEKNVFIKFDAWNTVELPLIRRAFPEVPWVFLYRDPVEVLVSQLNQRGAHMVPGGINPKLFAMPENSIAEMEPEEYCAKVLAAICQAALRESATGGMLINYAQMPEAFWSSISNFFSLGWTEAETETMRSTTKLHAKNPAVVFQNDSALKQEKATMRVREAASRWVYPIYEELEKARLK